MKITVELTEHDDCPIRVEHGDEYLDASWADEYAQLLALAARTAREAAEVRALVRDTPIVPQIVYVPRRRLSRWCRGD